MRRPDPNSIEVEADNSRFEDSGNMHDSSDGLIKLFILQPQQKPCELKGRMANIENQWKELNIYEKAEVPGVDGLIAEISIALWQPKKDPSLEIVASISLERIDDTPVAEFSIDFMQISLDRIVVELSWRRMEIERGYSAMICATISSNREAELLPDPQNALAAEIEVVGLDLCMRNRRLMLVPMNLAKPTRFEILAGVVRMAPGDQELVSKFVGGSPKPPLVTREFARLELTNPGALKTANIARLYLAGNIDQSIYISLPASLGVEVFLRTFASHFRRVGWSENFLFASGRLLLRGFPEISAILKFGTGLGHDGRRVRTLVLYGETHPHERLFAGAVVKSFGLGIGIADRPTVVTPHPEVNKVVTNIGRLTPDDFDGCKLVTDDRFYRSVIRSVILTSILDDDNVLNEYRAQLIVSLDTTFEIVAAGQVWLSATLAGVRNHNDKPVFFGAMVLSPSQCHA